MHIISSFCSTPQSPVCPPPPWVISSGGLLSHFLCFSRALHIVCLIFSYWPSYLIPLNFSLLIHQVGVNASLTRWLCIGTNNGWKCRAQGSAQSRCTVIPIPFLSSWGQRSCSLFVLWARWLLYTFYWESLSLGRRGCFNGSWGESRYAPEGGSGHF